MINYMNLIHGVAEVTVYTEDGGKLGSAFFIDIETSDDVPDKLALNQYAAKVEGDMYFAAECVSAELSSVQDEHNIEMVRFHAFNHLTEYMN